MQNAVAVVKNSKVCQENAGLVFHAARRYSGLSEMDPACSVEDLEQAGFIGLMEAASTYDPDKGKFSAWAYPYIMKECRTVLGIRGRTPKAHFGALSLDAPLSNDDAGSDSLIDTIADKSLPDPDESLLRDEVVQTVRKAVQALPDGRQRAAVQLTGLEGKTLKEAAEALMCTPSKIVQWRIAAFKQMKRRRDLRALIDEETRFCAYKGVEAFRRSWSSTVEDAVLWREQERERIESMIAEGKENA